MGFEVKFGFASNSEMRCQFDFEFELAFEIELTIDSEFRFKFETGSNDRLVRLFVASPGGSVVEVDGETVGSKLGGHKW